MQWILSLRCPFLLLILLFITIIIVTNFPLQVGGNTKEEQAELLLQSSNTATTSAPGTLLQSLLLIGSEGWGGLYSGLKPSILGTAASQVINFNIIG
ncbi:hypothetical protein HN873_058519 [Arachis hypogaea]